VNGVGPYWWPAWARAWLTTWSGAFFKEASWQRHDRGYARGTPARAECDRLFLAAMLRDAARAGAVWRMGACCGLAWLFWAAVRVGGGPSWRRARWND